MKVPSSLLSPVIQLLGVVVVGLFSLPGWFSLSRNEGGDAQTWEALGVHGMNWGRDLVF